MVISVLRIWFMVFVATIVLSPFSNGLQKITLVSDGASKYSIFLSPAASSIDSQAGFVLQKYIQMISGALLPVKLPSMQGTSPAIYIGSTGRSKNIPSDINWPALEEDGFIIKTTDRDIIIAGGSEKGSLYGVYTFLEMYLGCRKYSPTVEVIPTHSTIILNDINAMQVPKIKFRDAYYYDPEYMAWHKLDNHSDIFGMYVHTFRQFIPPEKYFSEHPEYFTMTKAGRISDAQLCLTNPDVFRIIVDELKTRIQENPLKQYWSVSQNDTYSPCECNACRSIDSTEGSPSGSLLAFVNRVADQFPDRTISTLAYQYTRAVPRTIVPRKNVNIMLCSIECNRSKPLSTDLSSASFQKDVEDWCRLTNNIYLWDYVVQFRNLISPFPNLRVLQPNIQYFAANGVKAIFEQGSGGTLSEFKELRTYLIAKLLWNPYLNIDSLMNDFLGGYYGAAAPYIRSYIDRMHDALETSGEDLVIYGYPFPSKSGYLSADNMDRYIDYFNQAEDAVKDSPEILRRVHAARLPLQFALLEQSKIYGTGERGCFFQDSTGSWNAKPSVVSMLELFVKSCNELGYSAIEEMGTKPDQYYEVTKKYFDSGIKNHLASGKSILMKSPPSPKYHNGDASALTNSLRGWEDYHMHWVGYEGEMMEGTIDLGATQTIRKISTNFLQDINSWIFLPLEVEYAISEDGRQYRTVSKIKNTIPDKQSGAFVEPFRVELEPSNARYIRIRASNMNICPDWHKGAGGLAWIFADEIVVE